jgi:inosine triphosphate pyrophosphatase
MKPLTFITGNQNKADYVARFLGEQIAHHKLDLDELQSLDPHAVLDHKVRQAYDILKLPVLVEDVTLTLPAMGRLPGTFVKWFLQELGVQGLCDIAQTLKSQEAIAVVRFALHDGQNIHFFEGEVHGKLVAKPKGDRGFGYDPSFMPDGWTKTRGEMTLEEYDQTSPRLQALMRLKSFLETHNLTK